MCGEAKVTAEVLLNCSMEFSEQSAKAYYTVRFLQGLDSSATLQDSKLLKNMLFFITGL